MDRETAIYYLKEAIEEYEYEVRELHEMVMSWEEYDDPGCDPGLQYEQSLLIDKKYERIQELAEKL